jgi:hypothetical protein
MEGERLGRVVAVALLALPTPVACAALGVGKPVASGLPPSPGSASPAVQPDDGVEAPTGALKTYNQFLNTAVRRTGLWAAPVRYLAQHARTRVRVFVSPVNDVVDKSAGLANTRPVTELAWMESTQVGVDHQNRTGTGDPDTRGTACREHEHHKWRHQRRPGAPTQLAMTSPE